MKNGFSFIGMLLTVLIVGILMSVYLSQYRKTVTKSPTSQAKQVLNQMERSGQLERTSNGGYRLKSRALEEAL